MGTQHVADGIELQLPVGGDVLQAHLDRHQQQPQRGGHAPPRQRPRHQRQRDCDHESQRQRTQPPCPARRWRQRRAEQGFAHFAFGPAQALARRLHALTRGVIGHQHAHVLRARGSIDGTGRLQAPVQFLLAENTGLRRQAGAVLRQHQIIPGLDIERVCLAVHQALILRHLAGGEWKVGDRRQRGKRQIDQAGKTSEQRHGVLKSFE